MFVIPFVQEKMQGLVPAVLKHLCTAAVVKGLWVFLLPGQWRALGSFSGLWQIYSRENFPLPTSTFHKWL